MRRQREILRWTKPEWSGVTDSGAIRSGLVPELKPRPDMRRIVKHFTNANDPEIPGKHGLFFFSAPVEARRRDLDVSFLAVDEIQIAADLERGHVFTDRILHRRGRDETLLLGAATMRPIIE